MKRKRGTIVFFIVSLAIIFFGTSISINQDCKKPQTELFQAVIHNPGDRLKSIEQALAKKCFELGQAAFARGDLVQAKKDFRRAVDLDPEFAEAKKFLANIEEGLNVK